MYEMCSEVLERNGLKPSDVDMLIPHQANRRIITGACERLGLRDDQVIVNIDRYGNTTSATLPLAARDVIEQGRLKKGDLVMFAAVGAGYTAGASLWRWAY
jgi:3-oxoacyl-[acyl-carrier-protein] synthase-3